MKNAPSVQSAEEARQLAEKFSELIFSARKLAESFALGRHRRQKSGHGEEFWQYREIRAGEPLSRIDWRQSARSQHIYTRETEHHITQTICICSDFSGSMAWKSSKNLPTKRDYSLCLHLALAFLVLKEEEQLVFCSPVGDKTVYQGLAQFDQYCLQTLTLASASDQKGFPPFPLPQALHAKSTVVFISDFLTSLDEVTLFVKNCLAVKITPVLLQINDPAEYTLPFKGRIRFTGLEKEEPYLLAHTQSVQEAYQANFKTHTQTLHQLCQHYGVPHTSFTTTTPYDRVMGWLYRILSTPYEGKR